MTGAAGDADFFDRGTTGKAGLAGAAIDMKVFLIFAAFIGDGAVVAQGGASATYSRAEDARRAPA